MADPNDPFAALYESEEVTPAGNDPFAALYAEPPAGEGVTWGDYGRAVQSGAYGVVSGMAGAAQYLTDGEEDGMAAGVRRWGEEGSQAAIEKMSPDAKEAIQANILPTDGEGNDVWDSDVSLGSALGLKLAATTPSLVASMVPGGIVARAAGVAAAGTAVGGAVAGAMTGGDVFNAIQNEILKAPDDELMQESTVYRGLREMGFDEQAAKQHLAEEAVGYKPLIMAGVTALTSKYGVEGMVASRAAGKAATEAGRGIAGRAVVGFAGEATQEGIEGATQETLSQQGSMDAGLTEQGNFDWRKVWEESLQGAVVGGIAGAGINVALGARPKPESFAIDEDQKAAMGGPSQEPTAAVRDSQAPATQTAGANQGSVAGELNVAPPQAPVAGPEVVDDEEDAVPEDLEGVEDAETAPPAPVQDQPVAGVEPPAAPQPGTQEAVDTALTEVNESVTSLNEVMDPDQLAALGGSANENPTTPDALSVASSLSADRGSDGGRVDMDAAVGPEPGPAADYDNGLFGPLPDQQAPAQEVAPEPEVIAPEGQEEFNFDALLEDAPAPEAASPELEFREVANVPAAAGVTGPTKAQVIRATSLARSAPVTPVGKKRTGRVIKSKDKGEAWNASPQVRTDGDGAAFVQDNEAALKNLAALRAKEDGAPQFWKDLHDGFETLSSLGQGGHKRKPARYKSARAQIEAAREQGLAYFTQQRLEAEASADPDAVAEPKRSASKQAEVDATEQARVAKAAKVKEILSQHPWEKAEDRALHNVKSGRDAMFTRIGNILAAAKAAGIEVPAKANKQMSLEERALVEYQRVYNKIRAGRFGAESAADFAAFDLAARGGALETFWQTKQIDANARGDEGAAQNDRGEQEGTTIQDRANEDQAREDAERMEEEAYEAARRRKAGEAVTGEAKDVDDKYARAAAERGIKVKDSEEKREEIDRKIEKVDTLARRGATEGERTAAQERLAALKAKRNNTGDEPIVVAGENKTGFTVEKRRKIDIPNKPTGPIKLAPRKVLQSQDDTDAWIKELTQGVNFDPSWSMEHARRGLTIAELRALEDAQRDRGLDDEGLFRLVQQAITVAEHAPGLVTRLGNPNRIATRALRSIAGTYKPQATGTFRGIIDQFDFSRYPFNKALRSRLMELLPNMEVHVLSYDDMLDSNFSFIIEQAANTGEVVAPPYGFYDMASNMIFIRDDVAYGDPVRAARVLLHEAVHAAYANIIENSPAEKARLQRLFDYVKSEVEAVDPEWGRSLYGLTNVHEMMTEAFTNPRFQEVMQAIELPAGMVKDFGLPTWVRHAKTAWAAFYQTARKLLGLPVEANTAMDALIRLTDAFEDMRGVVASMPARSRGTQVHYSRGSDLIDAAMDRTAGTNTAAKRLGRKFMTLDQIRQNIAGLFTKGGVDVGQAYVEEMQKIGPRRNQLNELPQQIAIRWETWARKNRKAAAEFGQLAERATMLDVNLEPWENNAHIKSTDHQALAALPGLKAEWLAMSDEAKDLWRTMAGFYRKSQNDLTFQTILNILDLEPALTAQQKQDIATRTMAGKLTDADKKLVNDETFKVLQQSRGMRAQKGVYFPLMRHGEIIVRTKSELKNLHGGTLVSGTDDTVEFRGPTEAAADAQSKIFETNTDLIVNSKAKTYYLKGTNTRVTSEKALKSLPSGVKEVMEDAYTDMAGKRISKHDVAQPNMVEGVDYLTVKRRVYQDANGKKISKADVLAQIVDVAYRVRVQREGFYTFESNTEAHRFIRENKKAFEAIDDEPMQRADIGVRRDLQSTQLSGLMSSIAARRDIDSHTKALAQGAVREAAIRMMSGNRIQKQGLKRENVAGASRQMARNLLRYAHTWSGAMARAEHMPKAREFFTSMREAQRGVFDKQTGARSDYLKELELRLQQDDDMQGPGKVVKTLLQLSYLDKLFSPAYSVINSMQPWMVTYPVLAGRYGAAKAVLELSKAYASIGAHRQWGVGLANTGRAVTQFGKLGLDTSNIGRSIRNRFNGDPERKALFDLLIERGAMSDDAGLEMSRDLVEGTGFVGENLGKFARIASQLPTAVEAINRATTALAAYNLARKGGMSPEDARAYAFDTVQNTQGDYSEQNAPRWMKNPWLRPAMQFRKYAQMITYLLFDMTRRALGPNPSRADRVQALKSLGNIMAVQVLMAGALSLPGLEFVKAGAVLASAFGFGGGWDDLEDKLRQAVAGSLGQSWEQMVSKGLITRAAGIDVSSRLSLSDIWLFGEPKDNKRDNVQSYLFQLMSGAPGSLLMDWKDGLTHAGNLEWGKAAEKLTPVKFVADTIKAVNKEGLSTTTAVNAIGFKTAKQAEDSAKLGREIRASQGKRDTKNALYQAYRDAKTAGERAKVRSRIRDHNRKAPAGQKVFIKNIDRQRRREEAGANG